MKTLLTKTLRLTAISLLLGASTTLVAKPTEMPTDSPKTATAEKPMQAEYESQDPYENFNRAIFQFNLVFSGLFIEPPIYLYRNGIWSPIQHRVSNFFDNVSTITTLPNDLLQGKMKYFFNDFWRLAINSTIGIGGLFDVAKRMGLKRHQTGFGDTLTQWGATQSPFLVLPVLGPSTFRDAFAIPFNTFTSPYPYLNPDSFMYGMAATRELDSQARLLPAYQAMRQAFDPYIFMRNGFFRVREAALERNQVPLTSLDEDGYVDYRTTLAGTGLIVNGDDSDMVIADGKVDSTPTEPAKTKAKNH